MRLLIHKQRTNEWKGIFLNEFHVCMCIYIYIYVYVVIQYSPYMVIESSLMYLLPFFGRFPNPHWVSSLRPRAAKGHPRPSHWVSMVIPPELGRHLVGKPGTSFMDFNPPRVWVSLKKHVECQKPCKIRTH